MRLLWILLLSIVTLYSVEFLQPEEAFKPKISVSGKNTLLVKIDLGDQIYLYKDKTKVEDADPKDGIHFKSVIMPEATEHDGEKTYETSPVIKVKLEREKETTGNQSIKVKVSYQGCSTAGLCYEPVETELIAMIKTDDIPVIGAPSVVKASAVKLDNTPKVSDPASEIASEKKSETDQIAQVIQGGSLWFIIFTFFGFGLLLALTPCVFPMIPIISSVIVAQGEGIGTKRAFFLSLIYVLSMSIAYTIAGILAGLFGANLQAALQTPWIITLFSFVFIILAMSMFDLFELQIPNSLQSRLTSFGGKRGGVIGIAIMGFVSALIVGPCVAAPLAGALIYIGQTGDALLGGVALFALSIGMGVPLIAVGTSAGKFMPKPGVWMDTIKSIFGVMLIGVSIWMISRVVNENITMLLWGALAVFVGINIGAIEPLKRDGSWTKEANKKALGLLILLYGFTLLLGGMNGAKDPLHPLAPFVNSNHNVVSQASLSHQKFEKITSLDELNAILEENKGKKVLVDFYADWCTSCKEYEKITFANEDVKTAMDQFKLVQVDLTANDKASQAITNKFGLFGPPAILFFNEKGERVKENDIIGYKEPKEFIQLLGDAK